MGLFDKIKNSEKFKELEKFKDLDKLKESARDVTKKVLVGVLGEENVHDLREKPTASQNQKFVDPRLPASTGKTLTAEGFMLEELVNGEYAVVGYIGEIDDDKADEFVIPSEINGMKITCVKSFRIKIPSQIYSISFVFSEGIEHIGADSFRPSFETYLTSSESVTVSLPESLKTIGDRAFKDSPLEEVYTITGELEYFGEGAFQNCDKLNDITLDEGLKVIPKNAFSRCKNLANLELPSTITTIEDSAFADCGEIKKINLPSGLVKLGASVFEGAGIQSISLPSCLEIIGERCFWDCPINMEELVIPKSMKSIGSEAFSDCSIDRVVIDKNVTLGNKVFDDDTALIDCNDVCVAGDYKLQKKDDGGYAIIDYVGFDESEITIPSEIDEKKITFIEKFPSVNVSKIIISEGLTEIGKEAFQQSPCKHFVFPNTLKAIGYNAFENSEIEEFILPDSVEKIGEGCCANCANLKKIKLSSSLTSIPDDAFNKNSKFGTKTSVNIGCSICDVDIPEGVVKIGDNAFSECYVENLKLPSTLEIIYSEAFMHHSLTKIDLPANLQLIFSSAFAEGSKEIKEIIIPKTVTLLEEKAFDNTKISNVYIESGCSAKLSNQCFDSTLLSISIPSSVTEFDDNPFWFTRKGSGVVKIDRGYEFGVSSSGNLTAKRKIDTIVDSDFSSKEFLNPNFTVYCEGGSAAYEFARNNGFKVAKREER